MPRLKVASFTDQNPKAWVESLQADRPLGYIDLHPDVFSVHPRIDLVHKNLYWQANYRVVDWRCITTRADLPYRTRRKPWPQKKTGRARHSNRRNQIWVGGAQYSGPRGPHSFFSMLPRDQRISGLLSMLTIKHTQNDLRIVETLKLKSEMENEARDILLKDPTELSNPQTGSNLIDHASDYDSREQLIDRFSLKAANYLRDFVDSQDWGPAVLFITE
ncbi:54S ribosomal protein L4 mitochondrial [Cichlidogyrus casuarinus]|uniref:Large ribosomal subunit protein uL4m n=1 Tax=Cichlidogyrus casuarinus TaxID=1844966 RepID=A0ABD2PRB4_9PLAT